MKEALEKAVQREQQLFITATKLRDVMESKKHLYTLQVLREIAKEDEE